MGSFNPVLFRQMNGSISEKLATVFNSIGATVSGTANTSDYGKVFGIGSITTTNSITPTSSYIPFHVSITSIADSGTSGDETIGAAYFKTAATTAHQTGHQLATVIVRTSLAKNIFDAYGVQSHLTIAAATATADANAHLTAISGKLTLTSNVTKGWANAGLFIVEGAGTVTPSASNMCHGVSIVCEAGVADSIQSLLHLYSDSAINAAIQTAGCTNMTNFVDFDAAAGCVSADTGSPASTTTHKIKIDIAGTPGYIPVYADY